MKTSTLLSAALLAAPIAAVSSASLNYAYAQTSGNYGLFISRPIQIEVLGVSKEIRVGIRVIRGGNDGRSEPLCTKAEVPDSVQIEILDAESLKVLEVSSRFVARAGLSNTPLLSSMTSSCREIRYSLNFDRSGGSLRLGFHWDQEKGMHVGKAGQLDIRNNETFTKAGR